MKPSLASVNLTADNIPTPKDGHSTVKKVIVYALALAIGLAPIVLIPSCTKSTSSDDDLIGNWLRTSDFEGKARSEAVTFVIGDKAYLTTGYNDTERERYKDLWQYDVDQKYWTQMTDFAGGARQSAVAMVIGSKAYVGTGYDGVNKFNDWYEYDPASNNWTKKNDFKGSARYDAVAFAIGDKGYIGTGYDGSQLLDFWEYDPVTDNFTKKSSVGGFKRSAAVAFVVNGKGYICSGSNNNAAQNDLWMYDPSTGSWTEKRKLTNVSDESYDDDYTSIARINGVAFIMNNKVFLTSGESGSLNSDCWQYDTETDLWTKKTAFSGTARTGAVAFTLKDKGFVLTGRSGSLPYDNMYEFQPDVDDDDTDN